MALTYIQKQFIRHQLPFMSQTGGLFYLSALRADQDSAPRIFYPVGGASKGYFSTMNFSLTRGDNRDDVLENYRKMARILGTDVSKMVLSHQTHTTNIRLVRKRTLEKESGGSAIMKTSTDLSQTCRG